MDASLLVAGGGSESGGEVECIEDGDDMDRGD